MGRTLKRKFVKIWREFISKKMKCIDFINQKRDSDVGDIVIFVIVDNKTYKSCTEFWTECSKFVNWIQVASLCSEVSAWLIFYINSVGKS